jgi:hypothetical protein
MRHFKSLAEIMCVAETIDEALQGKHARGCAGEGAIDEKLLPDRTAKTYRAHLIAWRNNLIFRRRPQAPHRAAWNARMGVPSTVTPEIARSGFKSASNLKRAARGLPFPRFW